MLAIQNRKDGSVPQGRRLGNNKHGKKEARHTEKLRKLHAFENKPPLLPPKSK